jgi:hypothetical protein
MACVNYQPPIMNIVHCLVFSVTCVISVVHIHFTIVDIPSVFTDILDECVQWYNEVYVYVTRQSTMTMYTYNTWLQYAQKLLPLGY